MASISLHKLRKEFAGGKVAVNDVDLDISSGEFVVLVGPSGCGKSTILRMIAGLEEINAGEIRLDRQVCNDVDPQSRNVAMVFQSYALFPHMTVAGNIGYGLKVRGGKAKAEINRAVQETATLLGLEELLDRRPGQLSGGQRQRVAKSRAMIRQPNIFLFDEPLSNLDAQLRSQLRVEIKRIHKQLGKTTVYVTHDQIEAMTLAERIVVLRDGNIEQVGDSLTVYDKPVNLFVAKFIGSPQMNVFPVDFREGKLLLPDGDISALHINLDNGSRIGFADLVAARLGKLPDRFMVGIRPEAIKIGSGPCAQYA